MRTPVSDLLDQEATPQEIKSVGIMGMFVSLVLTLAVALIVSVVFFIRK